MKCIKTVFVKPLNKYKSCIRINHHVGPCQPDLSGDIFGFIKVLRPSKEKDGRLYWIVDYAGSERKILAHNLIQGTVSGKKYTSGLTQKNGKTYSEYRTVVAHHYYILKSKNPKHKNYKDMPFFENWNPAQGGYLWKGAEWIIKNLGPKPGPQWSMDIIDHQKGFVPGNLRWASRLTQERNKRHSFLGKLSIAELKIEVKRRGYKLIKIHD